jgi:eukaryotic-like serine/threonine-protein kinase
MASPASGVSRFGRYEVLDELGRGAMGVVYRALDPAINRMVAIKSISLAGQPPEAQSEYRERFQREAEAAGRLSHPGIITIFDLGEEPETHTPYIVMEYVKGKSLEHSGKLTSGNAVSLVRELAEALDFAHSRGVIHRDLKPSNILLTEDGHAKIADFGIAKLNLSELTTCGQILGTPAFMSPEQLHGGRIDGRSDLFSLGAILYTLLTGHRPFQGNSVLTVSFKVVHHEPVPVAALNLDLPSALNDVVIRAMAKDPAERYRRGRQMARDLQNILDQEEPWDRNKEPGSNPPGLFELVDRLYAKSTKKHQAPSARFVAELRRILKRLGSQTQKGRRVRALALLSCIGAIAAFGLWQNSRRHMETPRVSPPSAIHPVETAPAPRPSPVLAVSEPVKSPVPTVIKPVKSSAISTSRTGAQPETSRSVAPRSVGLRISINPKVNGANLTVWVDDQAVLRQKLERISKKMFGLFGHAVKQSESVYIAPGQHQLRVNVKSSTDAYDESHSLKAVFPEGRERVLSVTFSDDNQMNVRLR